MRWNPVWAVQNAGWVARFLANSAGSRFRPRAAALHGLIGASLKLHREWIVKAEAGHRIRETGWLKAWRGDAVAAAKQEQALLAEYGIASELLDRQAISALEPDIVPVYKVGLLHTQTASVDLPARWSRPMRGCSRARAATSGSRTSRRSCPTAIAGASCWPMARYCAPCRGRAGAMVRDILRPLGYRVPLAFERGYHREFKPNPARSLRRPIHDTDGSFIMTPMEQGIRVTSGVELTGRDAPSSFAQLDQVVPLARSVAEFGDAVGEIWRGSRPTLPDSLPMIGPAPRHAGLWLAFGNQHIGFTTGPATGAAIAAMIGGAPPPYDVMPFAPGRYLS